MKKWHIDDQIHRMQVYLASAIHDAYKHGFQDGLSAGRAECEREKMYGLRAREDAPDGEGVIESREVL